jgi:signal transduction histidine kinase
MPENLTGWPEVQPRLFQPFVSAGKENGLGLGLASPYQIVNAHCGRMWLKSEPGWGACLAFRLPIEARMAMRA